MEPTLSAKLGDVLEVLDNKDLSPEDRLLRGLSGLGEVMKSSIKTEDEKFEEFERRYAEVEKTLEEVQRDYAESRRHSGLFGEANAARLKSFDGHTRINLSALDWNDPDHLRGLQEAQIGDLHSDKTNRAEDLVKQFQEQSDRVYIARTLLRANSGEGTEESTITAQLKKTGEWAELAVIVTELKTALDTQEAGGGLEWIPTNFSAQMQEKIALALRVGAQFRTFNMPTNTFKYPFKASLPVAQVVGETTAGTTNPYDNLGTMRAHQGTVSGNVAFDATSALRAMELWSAQMDADAIPVAIDALVASIPQALALGWEDAIVNGDTSAAHLDSDVVETGTSPKVYVDGLRKKIDDLGASAALDMSAMTVDSFRSIRSYMGVYGVDPFALRLFTGVAAMFKLMGLKDSGGNQILLTLDKLGPNANLVTGQLAQIDGIPVIPSQFVRQDLNASGVYDGTTTTKTEFILAYTPVWRIGKRPSAGLETERLKTTNQRMVIAFDRGDFKSIVGATETTVAAGVNITTA